MEIIQEFNLNELVFDNTKTNVKVISIKLTNGDTINIEYNNIIDTQFSGGNIGSQYKDLKSFLKLGIYSKSPAGGFINFFKTNSTNGIEYIIYSGVNEVSNSHYIVTIHKIIKI